MKNLLPLFSILLLTVSCSRYQYISFNSNAVQQNENREFIVENDSVSIVYNFNGLNAPVNIRITNKLDKPLVIDWKRSSLIVNGRAISYMAEEMKTTGSSTGNNYSWSRDWSGTSTSFSSSTTLPVEWQLIPPHAYITRAQMGVINEFIDLPKKDFTRTMKVLDDGTPVNVKSAVFTEESSPLKFRSYLTLMAEGTEKLSPIVFEHAFYISGLVRTGMGPGQYPSEQAWVTKAMGFGTGMAVVAAVGLVGAAAAVNSQAEEDASKK